MKNTFYLEVTYDEFGGDFGEDHAPGEDEEDRVVLQQRHLGVTGHIHRKQDVQADRDDGAQYTGTLQIQRTSWYPSNAENKLVTHKYREQLSW